MNKKYLAIIAALVVMVVGLGGYIIGTHSDSEPKKEKVSSHKSDKDDKDDDKDDKDDKDDVSDKDDDDDKASSSSSSTVVDNSADTISTADAESMLNNGQSIDGKIVDVDILKVENATELGQNIQAGEHLNFYPATQQYDLKPGDHVKFKVIAAKSTLGSWLITGDVVK